ncbi:hypothetical protein EK904_008621, partial [Melospiza melodia maxima]
MAALARALSCQAGVTQWTAGCCGLLQSPAVPGPWRWVLCSAFQRHKTGTFQLSKFCGGLIQANGAITQQNRSFHNTSKKLKVAALRMYACCVEKTDFEEFFN